MFTTWRLAYCKRRMPGNMCSLMVRTTTASQSMKKICTKYGDTLPISGGKLSIDTEEQLDVILKALGDYYKIGEISGKAYGTFAGKELQKAY